MKGSKYCILPLNYTDDEVESCDIYFSICKALNESICPGYENVSTCQKVITSDGNVSYYDMGAFNLTKDSFSILCELDE